LQNAGVKLKKLLPFIHQGMSEPKPCTMMKIKAAKKKMKVADKPPPPQADDYRLTA
jgi:hypothetical protein